MTRPLDEQTGLPGRNVGDTSSLSANLRAWRAAASEQSLGASSNEIYDAIERHLERLSAEGDVLDFGAGTGQLTRRLSASGRFRSTTGADLFARSEQLPLEIAWIRGDLNDRLPFEESRFDTVVAAEVIEHLENPRAVCRELFRLLRPGGVALLSTPNNESLRALLALVVRGHFVAFGKTAYPAHITALVRLDLERVLREAGFDEVVFSFTDAGGVPGLPSFRWQSLLGRSCRGVRFSDNVLVSGRKPR